MNVLLVYESWSVRRAPILIGNYYCYNARLASALLEKETLDLTKIVGILGQRPFAPRSNYKAYLELKKIEETEETTKESNEAGTVREAVKDAPTQLWIIIVFCTKLFNFFTRISRKIVNLSKLFLLLLFLLMCLEDIIMFWNIQLEF